MVADNWVSQIESTIFTYLQYVLVEKENAPFPNLNCTTSGEAYGTDFPTLYVHLLPPVETGNDLWNGEIVAIRATFELQVYSDKSESECSKIMTACIMEMKKLHFNIPMFPDLQTSNKKYYAIARFSRVIANGDSEIVPKVD